MQRYEQISFGVATRSSVECKTRGIDKVLEGM